MKVVITGADGQLGRELQRTASPAHDLVALTRGDLDLTDGDAVSSVIRALEPEAVINAAAYTAVDRAEEERDRAFAVNADGAGRLAEAAARAGAMMIHISTDFVFGESHGRPRLPSERPEPLGVYGASKLAGEAKVAAATGEAALILRTAWVYSRYGRNFVTAILERIRGGDAIGVVSDQVGSPTWARGLAQALWRALVLGLDGIHHWTDAGVASWYDFAVAIQDEALDLGLLEHSVQIRPLRSADYETAAPRPAFSVLDKTATWEALGVEPSSWRHALRVMLGELRDLEA